MTANDEPAELWLDQLHREAAERRLEDLRQVTGELRQLEFRGIRWAERGMDGPELASGTADGPVRPPSYQPEGMVVRQAELAAHGLSVTRPECAPGGS